VIGLEAKVLNADDALDEWYTYWDGYYGMSASRYS
jgi:hypothetical protein